MKRSLLFSAAVLTAGAAMAANPTAATAARMASTGLQSVRMDQSLVKKTAVTAQKLDKSNVVASKKLSNGATINLVKGTDGRLHKVLDRQLKASDKLSQSTRANATVAAKADENATLFEGFEGYDGASRGWIPEGWQQVSKTDPAHTAPASDGSCLVWEAVSGDGFSGAYEGNYAERVQVSMMDFTTDPITFAEEQDEWLITKAFTPKQGDYLTFQLQYSPGFTLLDANTLEFTAENNILEVLVSTDDGANWTKVWDVLEDAHSYTEDELWDDAGSYVRPFRPMLVNISQYVGKSIKVAFRYVGIDGESMMLDNIQVGEATPTASMSAPDAVFPIGMSIDGYNLVNSDRKPLRLALAPYKTSLTWKNTSPAHESRTWTFPDEDGNETTVTTKNLEAPEYGYSQVGAPSLVTNIGSNSSDAAQLYEQVQYGGSVMTGADGSYRYFEPSMYDLGRLVDGKARLTLAGGGVFGVGSDSNVTWSGLLEQDVKTTGMGLYVPQPAAPYTVSYAYAAVSSTTLTDKSTLKATIYKIEDDGSFTEVATGYCSPSEFYQADSESSPMAQFYFEEEEGELSVQKEVYVDYPMVLQFSADLAEGEAFDFVGQFDNAPDEAESNVYVFFSDAEGARRMILTDALSFTDGSACNGLYASFDANYSWLRSEEDAFEANPAGESKTFELDSYYNLVGSDGDLATVTGEGVGEWYTVSFANGSSTEPAKMTVAVSALPAGTDVRSAAFDVEVFGMKKTFYVAQHSEAGVSGLAASATKAMVNGGNIVVTSPKATKVAVYNVAGQKVAEQAFAGKATIKAANLAKGVYVLKFNDNTVVKLTK